jgi:hypothetical protein
LKFIGYISPQYYELPQTLVPVTLSERAKLSISFTFKLPDFPVPTYGTFNMGQIFLATKTGAYTIICQPCDGDLLDHADLDGSGICNDTIRDNTVRERLLLKLLAEELARQCQPKLNH